MLAGVNTASSTDTGIHRQRYHGSAQYAAEMVFQRSSGWIQARRDPGYAKGKSVRRILRLCFFFAGRNGLLLAQGDAFLGNFSVEVFAFVVNNNKSREIFYFNFMDRFHAQLRVIDNFYFLDRVLC